MHRQIEMKLSMCMLKITSLMIVMINLSNCITETPFYIGHSCENETRISSPFAYEDNLTKLLTALVSSASTTGFYKDIVGQNPNDTVYGLFLCRGDISLQVCSQCVGLTVLKALFQLCPASANAVVWFDMCMLRYSDHPFFSRVAHWPGLIIEDITSRGTHVDPTLFNHVLTTSMKELADDVVADRNFFATKESNIKVGSTLYSLGQCTKDLSPAGCSWCLQAAVEQVVVAQFHAGRFLFPSCNIVYGLSPFVEENSATTSPAAGRRELLSKIIIASIVAASVVVISMSFWFLVGRKLLKQHNNQPQENAGGEFEKAMESLKFDLGTIEIATSKFSDNNKLGEGGFGVVYKDRVYENSRTRLYWWPSALQHRNLVRLLGFCLGGEETILVYEYVPNKSLDYFLLETKKREQLDWSRRCSIIAGIARGLLYLHEDSSPGIIHRDLKASNILLDSNMNPKISDFGLAKIFGGDDDQSHGNTKRIVGTYGYMAPEYAMKGRYSTKSDVFSFGILLLEIVTGRSISLGFHVTTCAPTLLSYAWQLWGEGNGLELMDPSLKDSCNNPSEFLRYINIGLLCAEEDPNNRPTMSSVVQLLKTDDMFSLSEPKQPATFTGRLTVQILDRSS